MASKEDSLLQGAKRTALRCIVPSFSCVFAVPATVETAVEGSKRLAMTILLWGVDASCYIHLLFAFLPLLVLILHYINNEPKAMFLYTTENNNFQISYLSLSPIALKGF